MVVFVFAIAIGCALAFAILGTVVGAAVAAVAVVAAPGGCGGAALCCGLWCLEGGDEGRGARRRGCLSPGTLFIRASNVEGAGMS